MAAAFLGGAPVALNGQTWVTVVAEPASGKQRQVLSLAPRNKDSVTHSFESRKVVGASNYAYLDVGVPAGKLGQLISNCIVLAATNESMQVRTAEVTASAESEVDVAVFEVP